MSAAAMRRRLECAAVPALLLLTSFAVAAGPVRSAVDGVAAPGAQNGGDPGYERGYAHAYANTDVKTHANSLTKAKANSNTTNHAHTHAKTYAETSANPGAKDLRQAAGNGHADGRAESGVPIVKEDGARDGSPIEASMAEVMVAGRDANESPAWNDVPQRSGFLQLDDGPLWYEIAGDGSGVPLLTLHGGPGGTSCGLQLLYPLGDERPVIRYDQLGTGRSGRPDDTGLWQRGRFVEALHALRSELGLERMHLMGHSWGGALAAYYVLEKGSAGIVSLTLSSPLISTPLWIRDANALRATLDPEVQAALDKHESEGSTAHPDYQAATDEFYARFVSRGEAAERVECDDAPGNSLIYNQMWGPTEFYATGSLRDFDLTPRLGEIDVPTLFVTGEFDEARPETVRSFADAVPGARFEVIPGVGHASISRAPVLYRNLLRRFLREAEESGSQL